MISHRKRAANRRNSARSTGPRTSAGKARSSRNALRHGLAIAVARDAAASLEVERLSTVITGGRRDPVLLYHARIAAEAELEILRVRAARAALINDTARDRMSVAPPISAYFELFELARGDTNPKLAASVEKTLQFLRSPIPAELEQTTVAVLRAAPQFPRYDRYERRALSRRRRALRALDLAVSRLGS
jgi:hypothetical protein